MGTHLLHLGNAILPAPVGALIDPRGRYRASSRSVVRVIGLELSGIDLTRQVKRRHAYWLRFTG